MINSMDEAITRLQKMAVILDEITVKGRNNCAIVTALGGDIGALINYLTDHAAREQADHE